MLKEIRCNKFNESPIVFHDGLNVVLGDEFATNSIGKSTMLMVIDFVMGGESFIDINKDVVSELGHHTYYFKFVFADVEYYFGRSTNRPETVFKCSNEYVELDSIEVDEFRGFLKASYSLGNLDVTFRSVASLFSRVWGKENLEPRRPLDSFKKQKANDVLTFLLKLFDKYDSLVQLHDDLKLKLSDKQTISAALKKDFVPKINKKKYVENQDLIVKTDAELEDIKKELALYATNLREIANREVAELKEAKDSLLLSKANVESRLNRTRSSLSKNRYVKSKNFEALIAFFPEVNTSKIATVEEFHSDITRILKTELQSSERLLQTELSFINEEIAIIDTKLAAILKNIENPGQIVDRVYSLSSSKRNAVDENKYYDLEIKLKDEAKTAEEALEEARVKQLGLIEVVINKKLQDLSSIVYGPVRKSPSLALKNSNYEFEIFEDTGTGKAYSNLILFDWSIFLSANVPFLIHDSLLFKNIENAAVSNMILLYGGSNKQTFIAIDEIKKYGPIAEATLNKSAVLKLSDTKVLYVLDWRRKAQSQA
ncbi:MAG: DUF2326 domain-containing protein [Azonexaceae bacterium]|nr:DUF2326 domain-containing protein [Azonexaceae bacterium]